MTMTKLTTAAAAVAFLLPLGWQWHQISRAAAPPPHSSGINKPRAVAPRPAAARPADETAVARAASDKSPLGILATEIAHLDATNDPVQFLRVKRLILELTADELPGAFELVKTVRKADALDLSRTVFGRWGEVAPQAGLTVARLPSTRAWREAMLTASGGPAMTTLGLFETWVLRDPAAALAAGQEWDATQVPRDDRHRQEIPDMLASLALRDPAHALQLAATLTDESVRESATGMIQQAWALQDPEAALRWVSDNAPDETRPRDLEWLLRCITASQPDRALTLALTLENPHARAEALDFALINWAPDQPGAALEAMLSLPDEEMTPYLVRHAAVFLAGEDLAVMAQAAERLPQGERREVFAEVVASTWSGQDRAACLEWLSRVAISESARRKIQNKISQP